MLNVELKKLNSFIVHVRRSVIIFFIWIMFCFRSTLIGRSLVLPPEILTSSYQIFTPFFGIIVTLNLKLRASIEQWFYPSEDVLMRVVFGLKDYNFRAGVNLLDFMWRLMDPFHIFTQVSVIIVYDIHLTIYQQMKYIVINKIETVFHAWKYGSCRTNTLFFTNIKFCIVRTILNIHHLLYRYALSVPWLFRLFN